MQDFSQRKIPLLMDLQPPLAPSAQTIQLSPFPIFIKRELIYASSLLLLVSFLVLLNLIDPFRPQAIAPTALLSQRRLRNNQSSASPNCNYSKGRWIYNDKSGGVRHWYTESCPFLDPGFRCRQNGRKDDNYVKWEWQPDDCDLPRFNAMDLLERSRNGRIVFAGDSIGRNQWESMICMLAQGVTNQSRIYEEKGKPITKHKGYLSMRFHDYNLTVEYYRVPFLVTIDRPPRNSSQQVRSSIRVDKLHWRSKQWVGTDILVFNAGHWWNEEKTTKMGCYFQQGKTINMTMNVKEAFRRSLQTWKSWVVKNTDPEHSHVFFRSYSPVHFRDGTWNEGGQCDHNTGPETNLSKLEAEPWNNILIYETIEQMNSLNTSVQFLNITYLTEFRIDGHPSVHREPGTPVPFVQDCSHWCLPGVPDTWNKLLYAHLLSNDYRTTTRQKV